MWNVSFRTLRPSSVTTDEQKAKRAKYMREWRAANPERAREISRKGTRTWRQKPGNQAKQSAKTRAWRAANPEKAREQSARSNVKRQREEGFAETNRQRANDHYHRDICRSRKLARERYQASPKDSIYRISLNLRSRLYRAIRNGQKVGSAVHDLGCSIEYLHAYLAGQFGPGMSWENHGSWHIDHIKPLASFDLTDPDQLRQACHYTNLQPLWAVDNHRKHAKLNWQRSE